MKALRAQRRFVAIAHTTITALVVLVFAFVEWIAEKFVAEHSRLAGTIIEFGIVVVAAFAFRPLHRRVEAAIEAAFTRRKREAHAALLHLRSELTSFNDTAQLLRRVLEALDRHMGVHGCAIYLRRDRYVAEVSSFDEPAPNIELDDALPVRLRSVPTAAQPQSLRSSAPGSVAFAMTAAGKLVGFFSLEPQFELEADDAQLLASFAEAVGLALIAIEPHLLTGRTPAVQHNLPSGLSRLIGRDAELAEIQSLFERTRLVTVVGPGGIGKTRIACEIAAATLRDDGAWFVDLAPIVDPAHVANALARIFNIADEGGRRPLIESVGRALRQKHMLIVLDNCEHVIDAAAHAARHLLDSAPGVRILATSREPLCITGEEPYRLRELPVPPPDSHQTRDSVMQYGAAVLFAERAHSEQRTFEVTDENADSVARIVERLDGIPLAIELAARRVNVLGLQELDRRLDERLALLRGGDRTAQPRHQTLHALIGWSYDLLTASEQRLLRRCAIFRGAWSLQAIEHLAEEDQVTQGATVHDLAALVDKSLVAVDAHSDEQYYRLLESTRAFAMEQLARENESDTVAERHCAFYQQASLRFGDSYWQTDSGVWSTRVARDLSNIRAAIVWSLDRDGCAAVAMISALRWYWYLRSRREGRDLLERAHQVSSTQLPARIVGLLALAAATLDYSAQAVLPASEAARTLEGIDEPGHAEALTFEGIALGRGGHVAEAIDVFEEAVDHARRSAAPRFIGWVLSMVAYWIGAAHDEVRARKLFDEAAELLRSCNDAWQLARLHLHRAEFFFSRGECEAALTSVREAEAVFRERHGESGLCVSVLNAAAYLIALARLDEAWNCAREGLELALRLETSMPGAWAIGHLARLAAENGEYELAARLLGYANAAYAATGSAREPTEQRGYERTLELIGEALPQEQITACMNEGAALEQEAAVVHALAVAQPGLKPVVAHV